MLSIKRGIFLSTTEDDSEDAASLASHILSRAINHVSSEAVVLAQYERLYEDEFPSIGSAGEAFERTMTGVMEHLGGPPAYYLLREGRTAPPADNYPEAILREALEVYERARKSVIRSHMFMAGAMVFVEHPDSLEIKDPEQVAAFAKLVTRTFWEHAEAAYIRLASYWDRVGQVLDFAFFNIRKFDQNGFTAVMDRIAVNAVPMNDRLKSSSSWQKLRAFQTSEKENGLKWLLSRRNLIVHSLHLHPLPTEDELMFASQFNHMEKAHREKLRPRDVRGEVEILTMQLKTAAELFHSFLGIVKNSASRRVDPWRHE